MDKKRISWEKERQMPSLRKMGRSISAEKILEIIAEHHGIENPIILNHGKQAKPIRQMAMEFCYRYSPMTQRGIGEIFCGGLQHC
jgi:chromosomal replication initiation ATPase DnaA